MKIVSERIDHYRAVRFQNASGVDANNFSDLLGLYNHSSLVEINSEFFVHRKGVCMGSCVVPMLSDLLLARYGRKLEVMLRASKTVRVFPYGDDFLVRFQCATGDLNEHVQRITDIFETTIAGLPLTRELPSGNELWFLDLIQHVRPRHFFRGISSAHSKIVKRSLP